MRKQSNWLNPSTLPMLIRSNSLCTDNEKKSDGVVAHVIVVATYRFRSCLSSKASQVRWLGSTDGQDVPAKWWLWHESQSRCGEGNSKDVKVNLHGLVLILMGCLPWRGLMSLAVAGEYYCVSQVACCSPRTCVLLMPRASVSVTSPAAV